MNPDDPSADRPPDEHVDRPAQVPSGAVEVPQRFSEPGGNSLLRAWRRIGGGSLMLSLLFHAGLLFLAGLLVVQQVSREPKVDFLPGGGSKAGQEASSELARQVHIKRSRVLQKSLPMQKVVSTSTAAMIALPDLPLDTFELPDMSSLLGGTTASSGFGKFGSGGGFGSGAGIGGMKGVTFMPVFMFGREFKDSRKIAVVMDVSRSMTRYLPAVAIELDKIARQSVLVLYFGCGLRKAGAEIDDKVLPAKGDDFACFWQNWQGRVPLRLPADERKNLRYDPAQPMPLEEIYRRMNGRTNTYYINFNGITHAQGALMCREIGDADTIYWFSDFQDAVDEETMAAVRRKLKTRKQKLVIHASVRGRSFEKVCAGLVEPLGGEVVETKVDKAK